MGSEPVILLGEQEKFTMTGRFCASSLAFVFLVIFNFSQADAKTLFISDIDDTIKNSHILAYTDFPFTAFSPENMVLGMNLVYTAVNAENADIQFFYITNAPESIMDGNHKSFLARHRFPKGNLRLRESLFQKDFKAREIRSILKSELPDQVILLGDNGENDVFVYEQLKREYPRIHFLIYIRLAYSHLNSDEQGAALVPGQIGFVTALDLLLQLRKAGFVSNANTLSITDFFIKAFAEDSGMIDNGPVAIPFWSDCRDFAWTAPDADLMQSENYLATKKRIFKRCDIDRGED